MYLITNCTANKQEMVEKECKRWENKGLNIRYETRIDRKGYKAGALKEGMQRSYVKHSEFVAIFDADFQPQPDFLLRAIPFLLHNPQIALVQARWTFGYLFIYLFPHLFLNVFFKY